MACSHYQYIYIRQYQAIYNTNAYIDMHPYINTFSSASSLPLTREHLVSPATRYRAVGLRF